MRVVNFAHGALFMAGAYLGYSIIGYLGSIWIALIVAPLIVGAAGLLIEITGLRQLYERVHLYQFLYTFGIALILEESIKIIWDVQPLSIELSDRLAGSILLLGEPYPVYRLFLIVIGVVVAVGFFSFLERTKTGMYVRAAAENSEMVGALGVNVVRLRTYIFCLGACLASLGGVLAGPLLSVFPEMGSTIIIDAFVVVIVGGLGSFLGSMLGSLIIGFAETFGNLFFPDLAMVSIYIVMAVVLIFRPRGLLGTD
jgi:branched-chain amino acid transport system permease protein